MKKSFKALISSVLVIVMLVTVAFSSFTVQTSASGSNQIIALDIVWNDISFTYDVGKSVWNPSGHSYQPSEGESEWTDNSGKITVTSCSYVSVSVDISFEASQPPNGTAVLKIGNPTFNLDGLSVVSDFSTITAEGVPVNNSAMGKIIVRINVLHIHSWSDGVCLECGAACQHIVSSGACEMCGYTVYKREGDVIYFGEYPQTLKGHYVTVSDTADSRGYYLGNDNAYYAKVTATPYESGYKFSTDGDITSKNIYYFKVEPLKWRVISESNEGVMLLCESIIANHRYDDSSNNYKESEIRAWLNDNFYKAAFDVLQRGLIQEVSLEGGVSDKIYLLSYSEANVLEQSTRAKNVTDFARASGAWVCTSYLTAHNGNGLWMLRTPNDTYSHFVYECSYNGDASDGGTNVTSQFFGVVPALKIKL